MKRSRKAAKLQGVKASNTSVTHKSFYETWLCLSIKKFTIYLNSMVLAFLLF